MAGKVYLVGAGPGDPGLLTLRAVEVLRRADVVFYDHLVSSEVLRYASKAELVYVGKEKGRHTMPQDEINRLLVKRAKEGKVVVRLKGGDPLVFGRAAEEMEALKKEGVDFEVVPGVTAASAAAAAAKVPLTHRDCSSVVSFVTGHRKEGKGLNIPYRQLVELGGTIVVYMGVSTMEEIAESLMAEGLSDKTPVLVAEAVGLEGERIVKTTLGELVQIKKSFGFRPPAVWIVGRAVAFCGGQDGEDKD